MIAEGTRQQFTLFKMSLSSSKSKISLNKAYLSLFRSCHAGSTDSKRKRHALFEPPNSMCSQGVSQESEQTTM